MLDSQAYNYSIKVDFRAEFGLNSGSIVILLAIRDGLERDLE
jgi:hypothetical protein